jgi:hypothetical protein
MLTQIVLYRAAIASGALWRVVGISADADAVGENNAQATRAESAQTVLIKTPPKTQRELAFGERWGVTTSSKVKARKFWRGALRPPAVAPSGGARGRVGALDCRDIRLR